MPADLALPSRALTLRHPWAYAITRLGKRIENRGWALPEKYVGTTIALHAGLFPTKGEPRRAYISECSDALQWMASRGIAAPALTPDVVGPSGAIVAVATLGRSTQDSTSPWAVPGAWLWPLHDVVVFDDPVPCRGALSLWPIGDGVLQAVAQQLAHARTDGGWTR